MESVLRHMPAMAGDPLVFMGQESCPVGKDVPMARNLVELRHITKVYDDNVVLDDLSLDVGENEFITLLGPSGCGKTTTLRIVGGFEKPDSGSVFFEGKDITDMPPNQRQLNTVFQKYALFPNMNVGQNIAFGLRIRGKSDAYIRDKIQYALKLVNLQGFERRKVESLSGGQQQRIAIARALVNEPEILLLDEPLGALDLKMRQEMQLELKEMHDRLGITFIYVTHDQEEALTMSDKIVVMSEGKIQQIGTPEDVYNEPKNAFVADFIGESNIFSGIMTGKKKVRFCGGEFDCVDDVAEGTHITAVVRPEDVVLSAPEKGMITGVVTSVIFKGIHYEIAVQSGKNEMEVKSIQAPKIGEKVGMSIEPDGIHIMIAEDHTNRFLVDINSDYRLEYNGKLLHASLTKLIRGGKRLDDGTIVDENGDTLDLAKTKIEASIQPQDIDMTDDAEEGLVEGNISNLIYQGDHYSYVIHTDLGQDFVVYDEDLWNMGDRVGLVMPTEKMSFALKKQGR